MDLPAQHSALLQLSTRLLLLLSADSALDGSLLLTAAHHHHVPLHTYPPSLNDKPTLDSSTPTRMLLLAALLSGCLACNAACCRAVWQILAKEIVHSRKAISRLYVNKAQMISIGNALTEQLGETQQHQGPAQPAIK
jgi:hypothetical protein